MQEEVPRTTEDHKSVEKHLPAQPKNKTILKAVERKQDPSEESLLSVSLNAVMTRALSANLGGTKST